MAAKKIQYGLGEEAPKTPLRWLYLPFMLLLGLCSMALATQRIAAFFDYHTALGRPWGFAFGLPWYAPWSVFGWQEEFGPSDAYGFIEQAITHSQALFLLPQFIILGTWLVFMKKLRANANLHGSARWATEPEIRRMGYFEGKGVYVGGWLKKYAGLALLWRSFQSKPDAVQLYLRHNGPEHIMVFAPTRSGKGVGLILPTLLAWEGSSIVLDIKGENWLAQVAGAQRSAFRSVRPFRRVRRLQSLGRNPPGYADGDSGRAEYGRHAGGPQRQRS